MFQTRRDFFYLFDYVTRRSENLDLKIRTLPHVPAKLFVFGAIRNLRENYYFETLLSSFIKLCKNYEKKYPCNFFLCVIADLKIFSW